MARKTINQILGEYVSPRVYFDNGCYEFGKKYSWNEKLMNIAEFVHEGHSLMYYLRKYINYYYKRDGYAHMLGSLEQTINMYIWYIQTGVEWKYLKLHHFKKDKYELIDFFVSVLREDMAANPEKYPFLTEPKRKSKALRLYKKHELISLLDTFFQEDNSDYDHLSKKLALDINKTNREYIDFKNEQYFKINADLGIEDSNFKIKFNHRHLQELIIEFLKVKTTSKLNLEIDLGCPPNQIYYLVKTRKIKENSHIETDAIKLIYPILIELLQVCYGIKNQPAIEFKKSFFELENWKTK